MQIYTPVFINVHGDYVSTMANVFKIEGSILFLDVPGSLQVTKFGFLFYAVSQCVDVEFVEVV